MGIDARGIYHFLKSLTAQHFLQRKVAHRPLGPRDFVVLSGLCYWFPPRAMVICPCPWTSISTLPMGMLCVLEETAPPLFLALNSESRVSHHRPLGGPWLAKTSCQVRPPRTQGLVQWMGTSPNPHQDDVKNTYISLLCQLRGTRSNGTPVTTSPPRV